MNKKEVIRMPYIGGVLSVNHYLGKRKGGGFYTKPEVLDWEEEFGWLLKRLHLEDWKLPLKVTCDGVFKDERSAPDLSNLSKIILDTIQDISDVNDKNFRWKDGTRTISKEEPYLLITIEEGDEKKQDKADKRQEKGTTS